MKEEQPEWWLYQAKWQKDDWGVRRRPLEHARRQIIDMMKPPGKRTRKRPRKRWMDVVYMDMKMVGRERKMADDRRRWRRTIDDHCGDPRWRDKKERWRMTEDDGKEPSMTIAATPDDGTRKKDGGRQKTMAKNHRWPLRRPQMTGQERKMADDRRRWQRTIDDHCGDPRWRDKKERWWMTEDDGKEPLMTSVLARISI